MYKLCTGKSEIILWALCRRANGSDASASTGRVSEKPTSGNKTDGGQPSMKRMLNMCQKPN